MNVINLGLYESLQTKVNSDDCNRGLLERKDDEFRCDKSFLVLLKLCCEWCIGDNFFF